MSPSDLPERAQDPSSASAGAPSRTSPPPPTPPGDHSGQRWDTIAAMPEYRALLIRKARFIVAGTVFFLVYYFALPVLVGWFPQFMERKVGPVNFAYLFALSQFVMAWIVAGIYVKIAAGWDRSAEAIIEKAEGK